MGTLKNPKPSPDRKKFINKVLTGLVNQLEMQQNQILSLANNLKLQHEQKLTQVNLFQEKISQMKKQLRLQEMERTVEHAKSDYLMGLKEREVFQYKLKLEHTEDELADFKEWFHLLSRKCSDPKGIQISGNKKGQEDNLMTELESEVRKLKYENEKLNSKNSALSSERDFVWKQFKKIESNLTDQLKTKHDEIEQANEKIQKLLANMEQLQSSNTGKDDKIMVLRTSMAKLEYDSFKKSEEISRLTKEIELLRKSKSDSVTPVLRHCTIEQRMSRLGGKKSGMDGRSVTVRKDSHSSEVLEKGSRNLKRNAVDNNTTPSTSEEVPKLFSSSFKVPKLKTSSSPCVI
ncbi:hypothetical protein LguiA_003647 [Lonicera macranthoides]